MKKMAKRSHKKGLSGVVTTLIIISLSIFAVIIVWAVVHNLVKLGSEKIDIGTYTVKMDISKVIVNGDNLEVIIKRDSGKGDLKNLNFIISDGTNSYTFEEKDVQLNELETKTFIIPYGGPIKSISLSSSIGEGGGGNLIDKVEYDTKESVTNMPGLVSWWRFEGNANDEMGRNDGVVYGGSLVDGKFGKAYNFTSGIPQNITILDHQSLRLENSNMTALVWIYSPSFSSVGSILNKFQPSGQGWTTLLASGGNFFTGTIGDLAIPNIGPLNTHEWINLAVSNERLPGSDATIKVYLNGKLNQTNTGIQGNPSSLGNNLTIGTFDVGGGSIYTFNGIIDEVIIFNRTLLDSEIKSLYNLDLNN